jgi:hypothetical protein
MECRGGRYIPFLAPIIEEKMGEIGVTGREVRQYSMQLTSAKSEGPRD